MRSSVLLKRTKTAALILGIGAVCVCAVFLFKRNPQKETVKSTNSSRESEQLEFLSFMGDSLHEAGESDQPLVAEVHTDPVIPLEKEESFVRSTQLTDEELTNLVESVLLDVRKAAMREEYDLLEQLIWEAAGGEDITTGHILKLLQNEHDPFLREQYLNVLATIGSDAAVDALITTLMDEPDPQTRLETSRSLELLTRPGHASKFVPHLLSLDMEEPVYYWFSQVVQKQADRETIEELQAQLDILGSDHPNRDSMEFILSGILSTQAVEALSDILSVEPTLWYHDSAFKALSEIGTKEALDALVKSLDRSPPDSFHDPRLLALEGINRKEIFHELLQVMETHPDEYVRHAVTVAISQAGEDVWEGLFDPNTRETSVPDEEDHDGMIAEWAEMPVEIE